MLLLFLVGIFPFFPSSFFLGGGGGGGWGGQGAEEGRWGKEVP